MDKLGIRIFSLSYSSSESSVLSFANSLNNRDESVMGMTGDHCDGDDGGSDGDDGGGGVGRDDAIPS